MMRALGLVVSLLGLLGLVGACETPTPTLQLSFTGGPSQSCSSTDDTPDCLGVAMKCAAVMSIRIFDPEDPAMPLLEQCSEVPINSKKDMCALKNVELEPTPLPVRRLEVQIAVYPRSTISADPLNPQKLVCPARVQYGATGFPLEQAPSPALGGHTFYQPGDSVVPVLLGCTDLDALNLSCDVERSVRVTATVEDFSTGSQVRSDAEIARKLRVSAGEPHSLFGAYVLDARDAPDLSPVEDVSLATWRNDLDLHDLRAHICVEVSEEGALTPPTLRCKAVNPEDHDDHLDLTGTWLSQPEVERILALLSPDAPQTLAKDGLTLGIVVDQMQSPLANFVVSPTSGSVSYLTNSGALGGKTTEDSGIFVSHDAGFGTRFTARGPGGVVTTPGIGGLVTNKFTVVVLVANGSLER
jgi:hypothetical protein